MKKAIVSVINDLSTDRRVDKSCRALQEQGYEVLLTGRKKRDSLPLEERPYRCHRMRLIFEKGPLFYAEFNIRLFFFLLFRKADLLFSNDLDTLLPNYLVSRIKRISILYDSHEYFTETPEVIHRPFVRKVWTILEKAIVPRLKVMITVNGSLAKIFHEKYGLDTVVVRNIPPYKEYEVEKSRSELGLPEDKHLVVMQGSGINIQRGAEEAVLAMNYLDDALLLIIGGGDVIPSLKKLVSEQGLDEKVRFYPRMPFDKLYRFTVHAGAGLTLDKDTNPNYRYSLPNKLFDYIHAGVPVLASPMVEIRKIIEEYEIGELIEHHDPEHIALKLKEMLTNEGQRIHWKENLKFAASQLNWDQEKKKFTEVIRNYV